VFSGSKNTNEQLVFANSQQDRMPRRASFAGPLSGNETLKCALRSVDVASFSPSAPDANCTSSIPCAENRMKNSALS
jgi:hypothetical protein